MSDVVNFAKNEKGHDYVVGDIHGCFVRLQNFLDRIEFDVTKDRLFACGDLVDRGPESEDCVEWINKPWFHSVRGNHDQMIVDAYTERTVDHIFIENGGMWYLGLTAEEQAEIAWSLDSLPLMISVETDKGKVGIVHADVTGNDWDGTVKLLEEGTIRAFHARQNLMWSRSRYQGLGKEVKGVDLMITGHNVVKNVVSDHNVIFLDTGAVFKDKEPADGFDKVVDGFTIYNMTDNKILVEKNYMGKV